MLIGVVSDTHGHAEFARDAARMLETFEVESVLHCGDIGSPEVVRVFQKWPTHFVFGNVDHHEMMMRKAISNAGQTCHERFGELNLCGVRIAMLHSDDAKQFAEAIASRKYDLICYGHTHVAKQERCGSTLVLNPGALYRATPHTIAIVDLPAIKAEIVAV